MIKEENFETFYSDEAEEINLPLFREVAATTVSVQPMDSPVYYSATTSSNIYISPGVHTWDENVSSDGYNQFKMKLYYKNLSDNKDPEYTKEGDSGIDLRANLLAIEAHDRNFNRTNLTYTLMPFQRSLIPTGIFVQLPLGYDMTIKPRSGLAYRYGIDVMAGVIDNTYRGELKVLLINLGDEPFIIKHGDRIAQGVVRPVLNSASVMLVKTDELDLTERNESGFGSSGL